MKEKPLTSHGNPRYFSDKAQLFENSLWNIKTAAQKLSVSEKTLRDWTYKRQIPFKKVGHLVRFDPSEIHQWIEERSKSNGNRHY